MIPNRWFFILVALLAYSLPWAVQPSSALTLNAYDLAEWTSLHPAVRADVLPLGVTFGLRLIPVLLLVIFVVDPSSRRWERLLLTAIMAIALLPPLTFFSNGFDDPNHRQQLTISILALIFAGLSIRILPQTWRKAFQLVIILAAVAIGAATLITALGLMRGFNNVAQPGAGGVLFILILMTWVAKNRRGNLWQATS